MYGCNYYVELNILSGYMYCYRFELPLPDRNRYVPDRYIPFPISRNTAFVFPSAYPVPVPGKKNRNRNGYGVFPTVPDRFHLYVEVARPAAQVHTDDGDGVGCRWAVLSPLNFGPHL